MEEVRTTTDTRESDANKLVSDFRLYFFTRFGVNASIFYDLKETDRPPAVPLDKLEEIVNSFLHDEYPEKYPNGIRSRTRKKELIMYRHMFFKLAIEMGYSCNAAGGFLEYSHCQALWSKGVITDFIDVKDKYITELYFNIKNKIKQTV